MQLPDFAIPRYIQIIDALPKTPSEKVRKALSSEISVLHRKQMIEGPKSERAEMESEQDKQTVVHSDKYSGRNVVAMDSAYDVDAQKYWR